MNKFHKRAIKLLVEQGYELTQQNYLHMRKQVILAEVRKVLEATKPVSASDYKDHAAIWSGAYWDALSLLEISRSDRNSMQRAYPQLLNGYSCPRQFLQIADELLYQNQT